MRDEQIKYMVNRFLGWRLPKNFNPDAGISFKVDFNEHTSWPMQHEPTGTNLFDATQAEEMIRYLIDGMPSQRDAESGDHPVTSEGAGDLPYTPTQVEAFIKGVWLFAYWKDGVQYVGTTGTTYREVLLYPAKYMRMAEIRPEVRP